MATAAGRVVREGELTEAHLLSAHLFQVVDRMRADFGSIATEFDLTALQARCILQLQEPQPMRALADHLTCEPSNITGLADRLESSGLVQRTAGADRRVKLLALTSQGARLRSRLANAWPPAPP